MRVEVGAKFLIRQGHLEFYTLLLNYHHGSSEAGQAKGRRWSCLAASQSKCAESGVATPNIQSKKPEKAPLDESQDATLYDPMIDPTDSLASSDGDEDEDGPDEIEQPEAGPSRPSQKSLYAPPTIDEMDRLRSAQDTGNTFALQLEALVSATLLPTTPAPALKTLLSRIHDFILAMPSLPAVAPARAAERTPDIPFPAGEAWSPLKQDVKWTLGWEKPAEVFVGGSWSVCGGYKKGKGVMGDVDLVVVMPSVS